MSEIISCPSCQRKVQVPETLAGQDVQCPTCGATFVAQIPGAAPPSQSPPADNWDVTAERPASWSDRPPPDYRRGYDDQRRGYDDQRGDYGRPPDDYGRSVNYRRRDMMPHRGGMILTLGLLGILLCPLTSPFAWVMGNTDLVEIRNQRMDPDGEGLTQAGRILGIIGSIILILYICGFCLIVMMGMMAPRGRGY
jgi:hypothetical protein